MRTQPLPRLLELYVEEILLDGSPETIRLYRHTIRSLAKTLAREPLVEDLDDATIRRHMREVVARGNSPASANKDRSQLIALWTFAANRGILDRRPTVPPLSEPERVPLGWLPEEVDRLFAAAKREEGSIGSVPGSVWWTAAISVLFDTGERIGPLRKLDRSAVQGAYLIVPAGSRKGQTRDRLYPLGDDTLERIERLLASHEDRKLFPWPFSETYIYNRYNRILRRAKLPTDRASKFHRIRKTVASAVARAGGDATAALDHASPKTTKKYLDPRIVGGVEIAEILAAYLRDPMLRSREKQKQKQKRSAS